jgi:ribonuclease-3
LNLYLALKARLSPDRHLYQAIHNIFGFYPSNVFPYKLAFRHRSVMGESAGGMRLNNERLEYLGDAVLSAVVADFLFKKFPFRGEGFLTEMRSKLVSRDQLNRLSDKLGLDQLIQTGGDNGGQSKSIKGDAFEAFIGAMYLDRGYYFCRKILIERVVYTHLNIDELEKKEVNFKSRLIEWGQKNKKSVEFRVLEEIGTGSSKQYEVEVLVDDKPWVTARDFSIKGAEKIGAEKACNLIEMQASDIG